MKVSEDQHKVHLLLTTFAKGTSKKCSLGRSDGIMEGQSEQIKK